MTDKKRFVKLTYTGIIKDTNEVFDTTEEKVAEEEGLRGEVGPVTVPLTSGYVLEGLEEKIKDKEAGEDFEVNLRPEEAFGKRDPDKVDIVSMKVFEKKGRRPVKGRRYNIDGKLATVRSVTGGRVVVDYNHPLAGKEVKYEGKILKEVKEDEKMAKSILDKYGVKEKAIEVKEDSFEVKTEEDPPDWLLDKIEEDFEEYIGLEVEIKKETVEEEGKEGEKKDEEGGRKSLKSSKTKSKKGD